MIYLVAFVVLVLATARLTRLVSKDDLTIPLRLWIDSKLGEQSFLSRLVWCHWCSAVWVSLFTSSLAAAAAWTWWSWNLGVVLTGWVLLVPANAYAASRVVDMEKSD